METLKLEKEDSMIITRKLMPVSHCGFRLLTVSVDSPYPNVAPLVKKECILCSKVFTGAVMDDNTYSVEA
jgi:hypothetical protein